MLHTYADLKRLSLHATDGDVGSLKDAYFDDQRWTIRHLVVSTGEWLTGRRVLISPLAVRNLDWSGGRLNLSLTREQIRNSPPSDTDKPVSRQQEIAQFDYYGYPYYWTAPMLAGPGVFPAGAGTPVGGPALQRPEGQATQADQDAGDPHLRSAREVAGYHIEATDGSIGHVDDYLFDDASWALRYFVVDTRNWLPGRQVLISTDWIKEVSWSERRVYVALLKDEVRSSPEYDPAQMSATAEDELYRHYGRERSDPTRVQIR